MLRDWLQLARLSNAPTVVSNTLTGAAVGLVTLEHPPHPPTGSDHPPTIAAAYPAVLLVALAGVLVYSGGMILNDACDAEVDRTQRPGRPIPAGRVSRSSAFAVAIALLLLGGLGIVLAPFLHTQRSPASLPAAAGLALALVLSVVLYDTLHRTGAWAILLLAACRVVLVLAAASVVAWPPDPRAALPVTAAVAVYLLALSLWARSEAERPARIRQVMFLIAAISLLDAGLLLALGRPALALAALACFALCRLGQRRIMGS